MISFRALQRDRTGGANNLVNCECSRVLSVCWKARTEPCVDSSVARWWEWWTSWAYCTRINSEALVRQTESDGTQRVISIWVRLSLFDHAVRRLSRGRVTKRWQSHFAAQQTPTAAPSPPPPPKNSNANAYSKVLCKTPDPAAQFSARNKMSLSKARPALCLRLTVHVELWTHSEFEKVRSSHWVRHVVKGNLCFQPEIRHKWSTVVSWMVWHTCTFGCPDLCLTTGNQKKTGDLFNPWLHLGFKNLLLSVVYLWHKYQFLAQWDFNKTTSSRSNSSLTHSATEKMHCDDSHALEKLIGPVKANPSCEDRHINPAGKINIFSFET